jgi:hypothetical protein
MMLTGKEGVNGKRALHEACESVETAGNYRCAG